MQKRIKYFLAAAHCLNFTQAAEQMYISQQALTRQIALLEEELGVQLFIRTTRSVKLTEAGRMCRDEFTRIDDELDSAISRIRGASLTDKSIVTIGFSHFFSRDKIITPVLRALKSQFPEVEFRIALNDFRTMRHSLMDGETDLCIAVASDWRNWSHVKANVLERLQLRCYVAKDHPLALEDTFPFEKLKDYKWLSSGNLDVVSPEQPSWYGRVPCRTREETGSFLTMLAYVAAGDGFTIQPPVFGGTDSGSFVSHIMPLEGCELDLICAHADSMLNPQVLSASRYIQRLYSQGLMPKLR